MVLPVYKKKYENLFRQRWIYAKEEETSDSASFSECS